MCAGTELHICGLLVVDASLLRIATVGARAPTSASRSLAQFSCTRTSRYFTPLEWSHFLHPTIAGCGADCSCMASRPCLALLATLVASQFASTDGVVSVTSGRVSRVKLRGAGTTPPPELSLTWHAQGQVSDSSALGHALTEPVAATSGVTRQRTSSIAEQAMQFTWPGTGEKAFEAAVDKLGLDAGPMCIWREMVGARSRRPRHIPKFGASSGGSEAIRRGPWRRGPHPWRWS